MGKEVKLPDDEAIQLPPSATKLRKRGLIPPFPHTYSLYGTYLCTEAASYLLLYMFGKVE
jgi:hypothetical protein